MKTKLDACSAVRGSVVSIRTLDLTNEEKKECWFVYTDCLDVMKEDSVGGDRGIVGSSKIPSLGMLYGFLLQLECVDRFTRQFLKVDFLGLSAFWYTEGNDCELYAFGCCDIWLKCSRLWRKRTTKIPELIVKPLTCGWRYPLPSYSTITTMHTITNENW